MTQAHWDHIVACIPGASLKTFTFAEYAGAGGDVDDPLSLGTEEAYRRCAEQLFVYIASAVSKLRS